MSDEGDESAPGERGDGADAGAAAAEVRRAEREFEREGRPYARVTVVRREPPVSATVGDRALVTADGDVVGWVGGAECARSVAVDRATAAIESGDPVLVGLAPDPETVERPGLAAFPMTCHSGGTLELFVEPVVPAERLVVVGESPVARSLARLAGELDFDVTAADDPDAVAEAVAGARFVVVASMGEYDELGVEAALRAGADYVGLVASDRRRDDVAETVAGRLDAARADVVEAVTTPAGLDIGAETPEEIALSVLAEVVAVRRDVEGPVSLDVADATVREWAGVEAATDAPGEAAETAAAGTESPETVADLVCGMDVTPDAETPTVEHDGETYHFCGQGCADAFAADPDRYLDDADDGEEVPAGD